MQYTLNLVCKLSGNQSSTIVTPFLSLFTVSSRAGLDRPQIHFTRGRILRQPSEYNVKARRYSVTLAISRTVIRR